MKNKIKFTEKDAKFAFLFGAILILVVVYFFVYSTNMKAKQSFEEQNVTLKAQVDDLRAKNAQKEQKEADIIKLNEQIVEIAEKYGAGVTFENQIMMAVDMEEITDSTVGGISFGNEELFYLYKPAEAAAEEEEVAAPGAAVEGQIVEGQILDDIGQVALIDEMKVGTVKIAGVKSMLSLTYKTTYEGLKKVIDYVNQFDDKMTLNSITANYDASTGNLSGEIEIFEYGMFGTSKNYEAPKVNHVKIKKDEIFNTTGKKKKK